MFKRLFSFTFLVITHQNKAIGIDFFKFRRILHFSSHFLALRQRQNLSKELLELGLLVGRYSPIYIGHYSQKIGYGLGVSGGSHTKKFCKEVDHAEQLPARKKILPFLFNFSDKFTKDRAAVDSRDK